MADEQDCVLPGCVCQSGWLPNGTEGQHFLGKWRSREGQQVLVGLWCREEAGRGTDERGGGTQTDLSEHRWETPDRALTMRLADHGWWTEVTAPAGILTWVQQLHDFGHILLFSKPQFPHFANGEKGR